MCRRYADDLRAQVEKLEKDIPQAEATGKDCDGDRVALSHLKALTEYLRPGILHPVPKTRRLGVFMELEVSHGEMKVYAGSTQDIECFHNAKRRYSTIDYRGPMEFEMQARLA